MSRPRVDGLLEAALYGPDLDALERFYVEVIGLETMLKSEGRHVMLRCGPSVLLLFDPAVTERPGGNVPSHGARGPGHVAFVVDDAELDAWRAHFERHGVEIEADVAWPGAGASLYVRDPAGNSIEIAPASLWKGIGRPLIRLAEEGLGRPGS